MTERRRLEMQASLDDGKSAAERNRLGQFATPTSLAEDMLRYASSIISTGEKIHFLDPAFGTGAFFSALLKVFPIKRISEAVGFEIDSHYGGPAAQFWTDSCLKVELADFTQIVSSPRFNLIICNPPYVRHHHLSPDDKTRLRTRTQQAGGMKVSGLAGLYCYFMGLAHAWMTPGCVAGWLIPSEFMDVNYGQAVKHYLLNRVTLLHIHRYDPNEVQFKDAFVSSAVVWIRNSPPPMNHKVNFTFGGTLLNPDKSRYVDVDTLANERKWTRFPVTDICTRVDTVKLADLFKIKRGIATGDNKYFILSEEEIASRGLPMEAFTPILPSPRHLQQDEVKARQDGSPDIDHRLFLLDVKLSEETIRKHYPRLFKYLEEGKERGINNGYLCSRRLPWYSQENRPAAPIVCTYLGRSDGKSGRPFRFILNDSRATVANVYLAMYPNKVLAEAIDSNSDLMRRIWELLNSLAPTELLGNGRVYGGGLHKLEPRELGSVEATLLIKLLPNFSSHPRVNQLELFNDESRASSRKVLKTQN